MNARAFKNVSNLGKMFSQKNLLWDKQTNIAAWYQGWYKLGYSKILNENLNMMLPVYYPITFFHEPKISSQIISFWGCGTTFIWGFRQIIKKMLHWYFTKTRALISIWHFVDNILTWSFVNTYWTINENCCQDVVKTSSVAATAQHCCTNSPNVWS